LHTYRTTFLKFTSQYVGDWGLTHIILHRFTQAIVLLAEKQA
jgi:hypothetical protein